MNYVQVNYFDADASEQGKLLGEVWHLIHAIASRNELTYQVSFPFWKDPVRTPQGAILKPGTFGPVMRVFAVTDALEKLLCELHGHRLVRSGMVVVSAPSDVPETATLAYSFVRSRARDRVTDGFAARAERRDQARALRGDFSGKDLDRGALLASEAKVPSNFVALRSKQNGHAYSLNVERRAPDGAKLVNSYGLGGAVPEF